MFDLSGRVALVTGASRGIGRSTAVALASQGSWVAVNYATNAAAAEETLAAVRAAGGDGELLPFDVSDAAAVTAAVEGLVQRKGPIAIAVANAGVNTDSLLLRAQEEDFDRMLATNVKGTLFLAKASVRSMMKARYGRIIAVSSVVGAMGNAGQTMYAASKSALVGMMRSIAREYGSRGITANVVSPGYIETDMTAGMTDEMRKKLIEMTPAGRIGRPDDVASAVVYLASAEAAWVTGQVLGINGGLRM
jgi:3-oxoacyl-[acyl-carrier protein] reductase